MILSIFKYLAILPILYFNFTNIINFLLKIKIKIFQIVKYFKKDYKLEKVLLYLDLDKNIDITIFFKKNDIKYIDKSLYKNIFSQNVINFDYNKNIRLKIFFIYKNNNYIIYFPYESIYDIENQPIPYPPFSEEILNNYRNDIILPYYDKQVKKKYFYSLFNIDSKDIYDVKINNISNNNLLKYFKMIQTPFNDFGILYKTPVKLLWILHENNIKDFKTFHLKFLNFYLDEENMELKEHFIDLYQEDLHKFIISKRMEDILKNK